MLLPERLLLSCQRLSPQALVRDRAHNRLVRLAVRLRHVVEGHHGVVLGELTLLLQACGSICCARQDVAHAYDLFLWLPVVLILLVIDTLHTAVSFALQWSRPMRRARRSVTWLLFGSCLRWQFLDTNHFTFLIDRQSRWLKFDTWADPTLWRRAIQVLNNSLQALVELYCAFQLCRGVELELNVSCQAIFVLACQVLISCLRAV